MDIKSQVQPDGCRSRDQSLPRTSVTKYMRWKDSFQYSEIISRVGKKLRLGGIVAFPTETVYGLGCNALDRDAVRMVFSAKGRPLSDPLICHVSSVAKCDILRHHTRSQLENIVFNRLAEVFWPGPLSIVVKASDAVPSEVTAGTKMVAIRCPNNPIARDVIEAAGVPIAAPSANKFGRISPTTADHVAADFSNLTDLSIVDGGPCTIGIESTVVRLEIDEAHEWLIDHTINGCHADLLGTVDNLHDHQVATGDSTPAGCDENQSIMAVGRWTDVDADKIKANTTNCKICILRRGHITKNSIEAALSVFRHISVYVSPRIEFIQPLRTTGNLMSCEATAKLSSLPNDLNHSIKTTDSGCCLDTSEPQMSPGMLLTHYAPRCPTYLLRVEECQPTESHSVVHSDGTESPLHEQENISTDGHSVNMPARSNSGPRWNIDLAETSLSELQNSVVIDFDGKVSKLKQFCMHYFSFASAEQDETDLSLHDGHYPDADVCCNAQKNCFAVLREAEAIVESWGKLCRNQTSAGRILIVDFDARQLGEAALAVYDRLYRAASGRKVILKLNEWPSSLQSI